MIGLGKVTWRECLILANFSRLTAVKQTPVELQANKQFTVAL